MAIQMSKKGSTKAAPQQQQPAAQSPVAAKSSGPSWYKKGNETANEIVKEDKIIEEKKAARGKLWRFWLSKGEQNAPITFVDGNLTDKGILDTFMYREHTINMNGEWTNFVCVSEQEPCPICEGGDDPSLVGVFTVIDHREFKSKKDSAKTYKDSAKLFVAKRGTLKQLQGMASKRGGLTGWRVDVSRLAEQAPNVGDVFDFQEKGETADLRKKYVQTVKDEKGNEVVKSIFVPANYQEEIIYRTADELRELGFGKTPIGGEKGPSGQKAGQDLDEAMG